MSSPLSYGTQLLCLHQFPEFRIFFSLCLDFSDLLEQLPSIEIDFSTLGKLVGGKATESNGICPALHMLPMVHWLRARCSREILWAYPKYYWPLGMRFGDPSPPPVEFNRASGSLKGKTVNDSFNVWNHWQSQFRLVGPPFTQMKQAWWNVLLKGTSRIRAHFFWLQVRCSNLQYITCIIFSRC